MRSEAARLKKLAAPPAPPEAAEDALVDLAAKIGGCAAAALIGAVDGWGEWVQSQRGLPPDASQSPVEIAVRAAEVGSTGLCYIPDLAADVRFSGLPVVAGAPKLRFYCGAPLVGGEGIVLGLLAVIDFRPREWSRSQRQAFLRLSQLAEAQLNMSRRLSEVDGRLADLGRTLQSAQAARERSDQWLQRVLPAAIADELTSTGAVDPRFYDSATVLFTDFKEFTRLTEGLRPAELIEQLGACFAGFDEVAERNRLVRLKTMGDGYMCVGGLPEPTSTHAVDACLAALQLREFVVDANRRRARLGMKPWRLRAGINTGPLIAGVIGRRRFNYDVWGHSVNMAKRLEQAASPSSVNISEATLRRAAGLFETEALGAVKVKHLGAVEMHRLVRIRPEFSADRAGVLPNERFWTQGNPGLIT